MNKRKQQGSSSVSDSSTDVSHSSDSSNEKPERKKAKREYQQRWMIKKEYDPFKDSDIVNLSSDHFELREVFVKKNDDELKQHRHLYRKDYAKRPHVKEKTRKRLQDPEVIIKRKMYSEQDDVKQRKKDLAKVNRIVRNKLKEKDPVLYIELRGSAAEAAGIKI